MNNLDEILRRVLTSQEESVYAFRRRSLDRRILEQVKEAESMGRKRKMHISAAVAAVALMTAVSVTAVAAWQYKSAADVAEGVGDRELAENFEQSLAESAKDGGTEAGETDAVGESQSLGGYEVSFLGMVSGEGLSEYEKKSGGQVVLDRTYCAVAIRKSDGTAMKGGGSSFFISPLVAGLDPVWYNAASFGGGYSEFIEDGVLYRLLECDNVTCFADRELYLCVTDTTFFEKSLYHYDEVSGEIARNEEYDGLNALFQLEVDSSLADAEKADALIAAVEGRGEDNTEIEVPEEAGKAMNWAEKITPENIEQYCKRLEDTVQVIEPDEKGYITWKSKRPEQDGEYDDDDEGSWMSVDFLFEDGEPGMRIIGYGSSEDGMEDLLIETLTLNEDGTLTVAYWAPKEGSKY